MRLRCLSAWVDAILHAKMHVCLRRCRFATLTMTFMPLSSDVPLKKESAFRSFFVLRPLDWPLDPAFAHGWKGPGDGLRRWIAPRS